MAKIDIDRFVLSICRSGYGTLSMGDIKAALFAQGLKYKEGEIVCIEPERKFKEGDIIRHKNGRFEYEVIGTGYDMGWITVKELRDNVPFPVINYQDYVLVKSVDERDPCEMCRFTMPSCKKYIHDCPQRNKKLHNYSESSELTEFEKAIALLIYNSQNTCNSIKVCESNARKESQALLTFARKQFVEEVCEWLEKYSVYTDFKTTHELVEDFRKALEKGGEK